MICEVPSRSKQVPCICDQAALVFRARSLVEPLRGAKLDNTDVNDPFDNPKDPSREQWRWHLNLFGELLSSPCQETCQNDSLNLQVQQPYKSSLLYHSRENTTFRSVLKDGKAWRTPPRSQALWTRPDHLRLQCRTKQSIATQLASTFVLSVPRAVPMRFAKGLSTGIVMLQLPCHLKVTSESWLPLVASAVNTFRIL